MKSTEATLAAKRLSLDSTMTLKPGDFIDALYIATSPITVRVRSLAVGSIAANNETVVVGARLDDIDANDHQGSVYVFSRSASDWTLQQKLTAGDGEAEERFGESVAISGDTIVVVVVDLTAT